MKMTRYAVIALTLSLLGCAGGGGHPPGAILPIASIGMNVGIGDLVNQPDMAQRAAAYLDEIAAAGYAKEIRMVADRSWGPQVVDHVVPVIRAKGFRLLAILTPGNQAGPANGEADRAWITEALPRMADVLIGVQLSNEPWQRHIGGNTIAPFPPAAYVAWYRDVAATVRTVAPGISLVDGDLDGGWTEARDWWTAVGNAGGQASDVLSWHVYTSEIPSTYGRTVWITEAGDMQDCVTPAVHCFVYVWQGVGGDARFAKRPGGGILP